MTLQSFVDIFRKPTSHVFSIITVGINVVVVNHITGNTRTRLDIAKVSNVVSCFCWTNFVFRALTISQKRNYSETPYIGSLAYSADGYDSFRSGAGSKFGILTPLRFNIGALTITYTILGVPYYNYSKMGPKTPF